MQKNWYVVYTKPNIEKKVAATLSKKKIENFCPLNSTKAKFQWRNKIAQEPLFKSYVFVCITKDEISILKQVEGIINFLYWKGVPAIIKDNEITIIKEFTNEHRDIQVEQVQINTNDVAHIVQSKFLTKEGKFFTVKNKVVKVNLPSLGYNIIAKTEEESIFAAETNILQNNSFVHS
jgi:transcription antitermination factor NusG